MSFVRIYADTRERDTHPFDLVRLLDVDEDRGRAVPASEAVFLQTLERRGFTLMR